MEDTVYVRAKESDVSLVKDVKDAVAKLYKEKSGKELTVEIDEKNPLPANIAGGVVVAGSAGKIDVNNTLEERLKLLSDEALPAIRLMIFGPSATRKFLN